MLHSRLRASIRGTAPYCRGSLFAPDRALTRHAAGTTSRRAAPSSQGESSTANVVLAEEQLYRSNVGVCIVNSAGMVFAAQRLDDVQDTWQLPQGGIDDGEQPDVAALREVTEETSIRSVRIVGELDRWLTYDFPTKVREKLHGGWQRYKGQRQKWYLAHFYGDDSEIDLATEEQEFKKWSWMRLEDLPASVVEFKRDVYVEVAKDFGPLIEQLKQSGELARNAQ